MRILVIEDDSELRLTLEQVLKEEGHQTIPTSQGLGALELAETEQPDLILLDIILPDLDGATVARRLKEQPETQHIPILAITSVDRWRLPASRLPADGFLPKPFGIEELLTKMAALSS